MEQSKVQFNIISFAARNTVEAVTNVVTSLGYASDFSLCGANWRDDITQHLQKPALLLYDGSSHSKDRVLSVLELVHKTPVFGVLCEDEACWDQEIIRYCNEFVRWPCHEKEFLLRLKRLALNSDFTCRCINSDEILGEFSGINMIGVSAPFINVLKFIRKVARCDVPVLIEGETGTGKELAARAIHYLGPRRDYPFVPVNCGALPDNLMENELFGHEKGAFTDAKNSQQGLIAQTEGGTLFLDEVETLTPKGQVTLLRFLQDQEYRPLGSKCTKKANVRIIVASNKSLEEMVCQGFFRQDLLFRLNIMPVVIPPLRERRDDIGLLADHFLAQYRAQYNQADKYFHPDTLCWLQQQAWPGNVRELENFLHREFLLSEDNEIKFCALKKVQQERRRNVIDRRQNLVFEVGFSKAKSKLIEDFEKHYLDWLMKRCEGNVTVAAKLAGKERRALGKLLKKHSISKELYRDQT